MRAVSIALALFSGSAAFGAALENSPAPFRGYTEINRDLRDALMQPDSSWHLGRYLSDERGEPRRSGGLLALLGTYAGTDLGGGFQNAQPGGMNMLLWYVAFSGLSLDVGALCSATPPEKPLPWNEEFKTLVVSLCEWPRAGLADDGSKLLDFWLWLVGFDVPMEEFDAWKEFVLQPELQQSSAKNALAAMVVAALYNPHYLLRK